MSTLILQLPLTPGTAAPAYDYVVTQDGLQVTTHGHAVAAMLPSQSARGQDVVAVIPAQALSWHRLALPERVLRGMLSGRMESARAREVLTGVLEERLLDDTDHLHLAVFAATPLTGSDTSNAWVAACDRAWLQHSLQALESAGHSVGRLVAGCTPQTSESARLELIGTAEQALLQLSTDRGVALLPLLPATIALAQQQTPLEVLAEPAVMGLAEKHFGNGVTAQTHAQHLLQAAQSPWNLAQLELSAKAGGRYAKKFASGWQQLLRGPQWRAVRWGVVALVLVQIVALNALAWRQRSMLDDKRIAIKAVLQQTFPDVQLVVDAPLQMQRAVDDLARTRGVGSDADLGRVISTLSTLAPKDMTLSAIELTGKQVRLSATGLDAALAQSLQPVLDGQGLRSRLQDGQLLIEPKEAR